MSQLYNSAAIFIYDTFYDCRFYLRRMRWWILHRIHPKHRYHILKMREPGYGDPRHYMIFGVMRIVERYVDELHTCYDIDRKLSDTEVIDLAIESNLNDEMAQEHFENPEDAHWVKHYRELKDLWEWWIEVRDDVDIDIDFEFERQDGTMITKDSPIWVDEVDRRLHQAVSLRRGMWT